jgi:hypothetical protein
MSSYDLHSPQTINLLLIRWTGWSGMFKRTPYSWHFQPQESLCVSCSFLFFFNHHSLSDIIGGFLIDNIFFWYYWNDLRDDYIKIIHNAVFHNFCSIYWSETETYNIITVNCVYTILKGVIFFIFKRSYIYHISAMYKQFI